MHGLDTLVSGVRARTTYRTTRDGLFSVFVFPWVSPVLAVCLPRSQALPHPVQSISYQLPQWRSQILIHRQPQEGLLPSQLPCSCVFVHLFQNVVPICGLGWSGAHSLGS